MMKIPPHTLQPGRGRLFRPWQVILMVAVTLMVTACGAPQDKDSSKALPDDDKVLARVNGSAITQYDLELSIATTLGARGARLLDEKGRKSMLESLVAARAIAQVQDKALTPEQESALDRKTAAYREQVLVKMYLAHNTPADPVTQQMVQAYYDAHPGQFGARTVRSYEMLSSRGDLSDSVRDRLLGELAAPGKIADWSAEAKRLSRRGLPVLYSRSATDAAILEPGLRDLIGRIEVGQSSPPTMVHNTLYAVKIVAEHKIPARPLAEVSADIRKILLPVQLKKAVKQAADQVLTKAEVIYTDGGTKKSDQAETNGTEARK